MEIVVLIKPVPDLDKIKISRGQGQIFETGKQLLNSRDRVGLQLAVDLKSKYNGHISVVSICDMSKTDILREAYAMGCDACFNIWEDGFEKNDPFVNARLFGESIKKIGVVDLIICGAKSDNGFSGQTGPRVAEYLNITHATQIKRIEYDDASIKISCCNGIDRELKLPALITVDTDAARPKIPNALNIMKAFKKEVTCWNSADLNIDPLAVGEKGAKVKVRSRFLAD